MDVVESVGSVRDLFSVQRVFGEPIVHENVTIVPVAKIRGGAGAGGGTQNVREGSPVAGGVGSGLGYGISARPAGIFELRAGKVRYHSAIDVNRIVIASEILAAVALLALLPFLGRAMRRQR